MARICQFSARRRACPLQFSFLAALIAGALALLGGPRLYAQTGDQTVQGPASSQLTQEYIDDLGIQIKRLLPAAEGSEQEQKLLTFLRNYSSRLGFASQQESLSKNKISHSFSQNLEVIVPPATSEQQGLVASPTQGSKLLILCPLNDSEPESLASALGLLRLFSQEAPKYPTRFIFLGAESLPQGVDPAELAAVGLPQQYPLGSRFLLSKLSAEVSMQDYRIIYLQHFEAKLLELEHYIPASYIPSSAKRYLPHPSMLIRFRGGGRQARVQGIKQLWNLAQQSRVETQQSNMGFLQKWSQAASFPLAIDQRPSDTLGLYLSQFPEVLEVGSKAQLDNLLLLRSLLMLPLPEERQAQATWEGQYILFSIYGKLFHLSETWLLVWVYLVLALSSLYLLSKRSRISQQALHFWTQSAVLGAFILLIISSLFFSNYLYHFLISQVSAENAIVLFALTKFCLITAMLYLLLLFSNPDGFISSPFLEWTFFRLLYFSLWALALTRLQYAIYLSYALPFSIWFIHARSKFAKKNLLLLINLPLVFALFRLHWGKQSLLELFIDNDLASLLLLSLIFIPNFLLILIFLKRFRYYKDHN